MLIAARSSLLIDRYFLPIPRQEVVEPTRGVAVRHSLEQGVFLWPSNVEPGETLALSSEQLSMLIDGVDWRAPSADGDLLSPAERRRATD
jgi:hypothetical protein